MLKEYMKKSIVLPFSFMFLWVVSALSQDSTDFPKLTGPYLGQKPPGMAPELFAPGIVSVSSHFEHSAAVFSPDGNEVLWSSKPNGERFFKFYCMRNVNGQWSERKVASFCTMNGNYDNPFYTSDGKKIFFDFDGDIWSVEKKGDSWGQAVKLSSEINSSVFENMGGVTKDGSIYFLRETGKTAESEIISNVFISRMINGSYTTPIELDKEVNADVRKMTVFADPGERFIIVETAGNPSQCELNVSFRNKDNSWSTQKPLQLGWARFPSVSPDGKYLFFMTRDGIYWVSTKIINDLKPNE